MPHARRFPRRFRIGFFGATLALGAAAGLVAPVLPAQAAVEDCQDDSNLCLSPLEGAKWEPGRSSSRRDRKRRTKKNAGTLSLSIDNGRGSLFINGRYAGTAPLDGVEIPRGKNDIQVRDGADVLASGLLTVPRGGAIEIVVHHP